MEAPFIRPTNTLILEPLRLTAGARIAEVMLHKQPLPVPSLVANHVQYSHFAANSDGNDAQKNMDLHNFMAQMKRDLRLG